MTYNPKAKLIRGDRLTTDQRRQVLAAFVYRHLDTTSLNDDDWLRKHAFYFTKAGRLAVVPKYAEPHYMADNPSIQSAIKKAQQLANRTGRAYEVRTLSRSEAARVSKGLRGYVEREIGTRHNPDKVVSSQKIEDVIRAGDRVTIVNRFGQRRTGRAVMRGPAGWVLNMGGPHGTPAIADNESIVKVVKGGRR
jgi:hypothetical protein